MGQFFWASEKPGSPVCPVFAWTSQACGTNRPAQIRGLTASNTGATPPGQHKALLVAIAVASVVRVLVTQRPHCEDSRGTVRVWFHLPPEALDEGVDAAQSYIYVLGPNPSE